MDLDIILAAEAGDAETAAIRAGTPEELAAFVRARLEAACEAGQETLLLGAVPPAGRQSEDFQNIGAVERAAVEFGRDHGRPSRVLIVCDDEAYADLHRVVYNFWFAGSKSDRLNGGRWD